MRKSSVSSKKQSTSVPEPNVLDTAKKVKNRLREEREMKKLFESIAARLLEEQDRSIQSQIDARVREAVSKISLEVRHDLLSMDSALSSRLSSIEAKVSALSEKLEESQTENKKNIESIRVELANATSGWKSAWETERSKRLSGLKKLGEDQDKSLSSLQGAMNTQKTETMNVINSLNDDLRVHAKEISSLKDKLDEMLMKQYGSAPGLKMATSSHGPSGMGADANTILENLGQRLQRLESTIAADEDLNYSFDLGNQIRPSSPRRQTKNVMSRIRRLEEHLLELQSQIKENEIDVEQLKSQLVNKVRSHRSDNEHSFSPPRSQSQRREPTPRLEDEEKMVDIKDLDKRVKKLADNTTKAVRSLSTGLSEVQQATLNLYTWTDQVHDAFERVAHKTELPSNLCPRAKVSRTSRQKFEFS